MHVQDFATDSKVATLLRPGRGAEYCDQPVCLCVCLSASIYLEPLDRPARNFAAVARSSSGGVTLRYVLPVLWMALRLAVMGRMALRGRPEQRRLLAPLHTRPGRSLMSMNACFSGVKLEF